MKNHRLISLLLFMCMLCLISECQKRIMDQAASQWSYLSHRFGIDRARSFQLTKMDDILEPNSLNRISWAGKQTKQIWKK